ncbi:hypothetical protein LDK45_16110, partial [Lactiplantibacillus plantarum]|uniref:hypothetical protein n=1 Tax=Lactiplantibacillus plantarum TaxID=1590 RepID=UPI00223866F6
RDKVEIPKVIAPYSWLELATTIVRDCFGLFLIFVRINYRIYQIEDNLCNSLLLQRYSKYI